MPSPWSPLVDTIVETFVGSMKDVLEEGKENLPFLRQLAEDMAREWWLMTTALTQAEQKIHADNLESLKASAHLRALHAGVKVKLEAKGVFDGIIKGVLEFGVKFAFKLIVP